MQHVYVPRFDGGLAGVQVGHPPPAFHYVSPAPFAIPSTPLTTAACTTAIVPKTFYLNGYTYYASLRCGLILIFHILCGVHLDQAVHCSSMGSLSDLSLRRATISFHVHCKPHVMSTERLLTSSIAACRWYHGPPA
jgi:hypothetical protein